jgi:AraC-like DNA-binding protein
MVNPTSERLFFDTDVLPERDRFPAFCEEIIRRYAAVDIVVRDQSPFRGTIALQRAGTVDIGYITGTPGSSYIRAPKLLRDGDDALCILLWQSGSAIQTQFDHPQTLTPGDGIVCDNAHSGALHIMSTSQIWNLRVPRSKITNLVPRLDQLAGAKLARDPVALRLLFACLSGTRSLDLIGGGRAALLYDEHIIGLIALALGAEGDQRVLAEERGVRAARRVAVIREIENFSGDPGLSASTIAVRLGITPRYVHLLLEETGRTFSQHVLEKRLEKAAAQLRDPRQFDRNIADIAFAAGFADLSQFNRAFRRHFGDTPSDVRANSGKRRT